MRKTGREFPMSREPGVGGNPVMYLSHPIPSEPRVRNQLKEVDALRGSGVIA